MCQTNMISDSILKVSRRSFNQTLNVYALKMIKYKRGLRELITQTSNLYEIMYDNYPSITPEEYQRFSANYSFMIKTLKELCDAYHTLECYVDIQEDVKRLLMNISALEEIEQDILNFKIALSQNEKLHLVVKKIKSLRS